MSLRTFQGGVHVLAAITIHMGERSLRSGRGGRRGGEKQLHQVELSLAWLDGLGFVDVLTILRGDVNVKRESKYISILM